MVVWSSSIIYPSGAGDFRTSLGIAYDVDVRNEVQAIRESQARQEKI